MGLLPRTVQLDYGLCYGGFFLASTPDTAQAALGQQDKVAFDHYLVISTTLDLIPGFTDVNTMKQNLFGRMKFMRYITTIVNTQGILDDFIHCYVDQTDEANINGLTLLTFGRDADGQLEYGHQIVDRNITAEEAFLIGKELRRLC